MGIQFWRQETSVLADLRTRFGDTLSLGDNNKLVLERGSKYSNDQRIFIKEPKKLEEHFLKLIETGKECFDAIKKNESENRDYERVALFKREVKCLSIKISKLGCSLEGGLSYTPLYQKAADLLKEVWDYKKSLEVPPLHSRPKKTFKYDKDTELQSRYAAPKRVHLSDMVNAALNALALAQPKPQNRIIYWMNAIGGALIMGLPLFSAAVLTGLKILLWNPIEKMIRGEVRTRSPWSVILESLENSQLQYNRHLKAFYDISRQFLRRLYISEEVANYFAQLSSAVKVLDLNGVQIASDDIMDLAPLIQEDSRKGAIPVKTYLETLKKVCKDRNIELRTLFKINHLYTLHNSLYLREYSTGDKKINFEDFIHQKTEKNKTLDIFKASPSSPYITPKALYILLEAAAKSSTCWEIILSEPICKMGEVQKFLQENNYRIFKEDKFNKTYRRNALV